MITLSTGVGVCVLNDGRPHRGGDGLHPETGHPPVPGAPAPCYCGLSACWEQKASRTALDRRCRAFAGPGAGPPGALAELAVSRARSGDPAARELFRQHGNDIGVGLGMLPAVFGPPASSSAAAPRYLDLFSPGIQQAIGRHHPAELHAAGLGDLAGAIGAAEIARSELGAARPGHDAPPVPSAG